MKYLSAFFLLFFLCAPAFAQDKARPNTVVREKGAPPPEPRAFKGSVAPQTMKTGQPKARQPNVEIWLPPQFQSSERKWPLIIFSHGFGGCARQSKFLTKYLADNGYIVIAPDHEDADCRRSAGGGIGARMQEMRAGKISRPEKPFRTPGAWTDKVEADRKDDVLFALSSMLDDRQYKNYVDLEHVGLMGHSLGGYTVLGLAGAWPSWKDKRFKAVLALSPFIEPFILNKGLRRLNVPVMYQGGTRDNDITPSLKRTGGAYAQTPAPKYFIEYQGADHYAWTELEPDYQAIIQKTALEFFDRYLKEKPVLIDYKAGKTQVKTFLEDETANPDKK